MSPERAVAFAQAEKTALAHAMHTGVLAPGKRTRLVLTMLDYHGLKGNQQAVLDFACSFEMVHTASLFMDDLPCLDTVQTLPGLPAAHVQYEQDAAMLAAVALVSEALRLVASVNVLLAELRSQLVIVLSRSVGPKGFAKGQYLDLHNGLKIWGEQDIACVNGQKTGVLFATAPNMAAVACNASNISRTGVWHLLLTLDRRYKCAMTWKTDHKH